MKKVLVLLILCFSVCLISKAQDVSTLRIYQKALAVKVPVTQQWTSTGVNIGVGDTLTVIVDGLASPGSNGNANIWGWMGPEGLGDNIDTVHNHPLKTVASYSVIGRIGSGGNPFYVGRNRSFQTNASGILYLGYNDDDFADNDGYYIAFIIHKSIYAMGVSSENSLIPRNISLQQNYPNPFNPSTTIEYQLPHRSNVEIKIYNSIGQVVRTLVTEEQQVGNYSIVWDGRNDSGNSVSSGNYFYQIKTDGFAQAKKMLLLK